MAKRMISQRTLQRRVGGYTEWRSIKIPPPVIHAGIPNFPVVSTHFRRTLASIGVGLPLIANTIANLAAYEIQEEAPVRFTAQLWRSIQQRTVVPNTNVTVTNLTGKWHSEVFSTAHYTKWVVEGRPEAHAKTRGGKQGVMRFVVPATPPRKGRPGEVRIRAPGEVLYRRKVRQVAPNFFHVRGWERAKPQIAQYLYLNVSAVRDNLTGWRTAIPVQHVARGGRLRFT